MVRPTCSQASCVSPPLTQIATNLVAPSPSRTISCASSIISVLSASAKAGVSESTRTPLKPVADNVTASLVEVSPSTVIRLKLTLFARRNSLSSDDCSISASVAIKANIVARFGQIIPAPFDIPVIRQTLPSTSTSIVRSFGRVSVVRIAAAARCQLSASRF